ncbi:MAG: hypothetical protein ABFD94_17545 [Armatimonadia bacterium]
MSGLQLLLTLYLYAGPVGILIVFVLMGRNLAIEIQRSLTCEYEGLFLHEDEPPCPGTNEEEIV